MKSRRAKVLHEIAGRPMLAYPLERRRVARRRTRLVVVIGRDAETVRSAFAERAEFVVQAEQRGTGHAVQTALPALAGFGGDVLILYGDMPLLRAETLERMRALKARDQGADLAMLTVARAACPGIVVRDSDGRVERIVEQTDATPRGARDPRAQHGRLPARLRACSRSALARARRPRTRRRELYLTDVDRDRACATAARVEALRARRRRRSARREQPRRARARRPRCMRRAQRGRG